MGYTRQFIKGIGWVGFFRFGSKAIVFIKVLIAYRFLSPRSVGVFGICAIILGLLEMLTETGINIVLVRDSKPLRYYLDTAFVVSIVRGFLISLGLVVLAFALPTFFKEPLLFTPLLAASLIPIARGFINPAVAKYAKNLEFGKDSMLKLAQVVYDSLLAIAFVSIFHSALSLVLAILSSSLVETAISFIIVRPWPKLAFDKKVFSHILKPGKWLNIASILGYAEQNFDNLLVGKLLGAEALGFYQTAFNLTNSLITEVGVTFSQVLTPMFGKISGDKHRAIRAIAKTLLSTAVLMLIPLILLNIPFIQNVLLLALKEKWRPAFALIPYMAIGEWLTGLNVAVLPVYYVKNALQSLVALYALNLAVLLIGIYLFVQYRGLLGAAIAVMAVRLIMQPFYIWRTAKALAKDHED